MTAIFRKWRLTFWQTVFLLIMVMGVVLSVVRYTKGLGAVTNLSDRFPWGLWVGFDLLCGVGLAAGGFVLTAAVYVFHIEKFRPVVRATLLTAFLGYLLVSTALVFDIGRPWNIWHPLVMWNPHSVMFEVSWCVTLYSTVLALEFSGLIFEKLKWMRAAKAQHAVTVPLVIAGVLLSTLHQSSLGTVYLIVPGKLHPIWYTPALPFLFWLSAVAVGLAMVIVESRISARAFGKQLETPVLALAGRALIGVLAVYATLRIYDLATRGMIGRALDLSYESCLFLVEFVLGVIAPLLLLALPKMRAKPRWLYLGSIFAVFGFVANRLNVSITGFEGAQGGHYIPSFGEVGITVFLVALGFGGFALAVKYLNIFPASHEEGAHGVTGVALPIEAAVQHREVAELQKV